MIRRMVDTFRKKRDLTSGSISKAIWILSLPMIISNVLQTALNVVDMIWVGRLGPNALAAVAVSSSIVFVLISVFIGVGSGAMALVARAAGRKDFNHASYVSTQAFILGFLAGMVLGVIGFFFSRQFLQMLGADSTVVTLGTPYLKILLMGFVIFIFLGLSNIILQAAGDAFTPMLIMVGVTILNIILDPLLIFGIWIFPRLGIAGAAVATIVAEFIGILIALEVLFRGRSHLKILTSYFKVDFGVIWNIIRIGVPSSLQLASRSIMGLVLMAIVAVFGVPALAAFGVGIRLHMVVLMPGFGLATAAAALVGQNLGAANPERAAKSALLATVYYMLIMAVIGSLFFVFAPYWILMFNNSPEVIRIGTDFLRITSITFVFIALGMVLGRAQAGAGDTLSPFILTLISLWGVQVPLALILAYNFNLGLDGIWYAIMIAPVVNGLLNAFWFQFGRWKLRKI